MSTSGAIPRSLSWLGLCGFPDGGLGAWHLGDSPAAHCQEAQAVATALALGWPSRHPLAM